MYKIVFFISELMHICQNQQFPDKRVEELLIDKYLTRYTKHVALLPSLDSSSSHNLLLVIAEEWRR